MAKKVHGQVDAAQWKEHCLPNVYMILKANKIYF